MRHFRGAPRQPQRWACVQVTSAAVEPEMAEGRSTAVSVGSGVSDASGVSEASGVPVGVAVPVGVGVASASASPTTSTP